MPDVNFDQSMAAAAVAGAGASAILNRDPDSTWRKVAEGCAGACVGVFCGPMAADAAGLANQHSRMAAGFAVGAAGIILLTAFMSWAKGQSASDWLARLVGKGK